MRMASRIDYGVLVCAVLNLPNFGKFYTAQFETHPHLLIIIDRVLRKMEFESILESIVRGYHIFQHIWNAIVNKIQEDTLYIDIFTHFYSNNSERVL